MAGKGTLKSYIDFIPKREVFKWFLVFVFFSLAVNYFYNHPEILNTLKSISPVSVLIIAVIEIFFLLNMSLILKILLKFFNLQLLVRECFGIVSLASVGNYMTVPGGGTFSKALYLKKRHDLPYSLFISSMSATRLIDLIWISIMGSAVVVLIGGTLTTGAAPLILCFSLVGLASIGALLLSPHPFKSGRGPVLRAIYNVLDGWRLIRKDRGLIIKLSMFLLANHLLWTLELMAGFEAFSVEIGFAEALLLGVITTLSSFVKITPANLGIQEAVVASSSHLLGIGFGQGLLVAGLLRVVSAIAVFALALISGPQLLKKARCFNIAPK